MQGWSSHRWGQWSDHSHGWPQGAWASRNDGYSAAASGSNDTPAGPPQPAQQDNGGGQNTHMEPEWDDGWFIDDPLTEAEIAYRVRTTSCTPIEWSLLCDSEEYFEFPRKMLSKVTRHWGKPNAVSETKTLLSCVCNKRNFAKGEAVEPGSVGFILSKSLIAANRSDFQGDPRHPNTCYCLPMSFMAGCRHGSPPIFTARLKLVDTYCLQCTKCLRCGKFLE